MFKKITIICGLFAALNLSVFAAKKAHAGQERLLTDVDVVSIKERPDPHYKPLGIPAGSFLVRPGVEVEGRFDDNIFRTPNNEQDDFITIVKPTLAVNLNWSRHRLNAQISGSFGRYADNGNEDFDDYDAYVGGRYDVEHDTYLTGEALYEHLHEDRSDPSDAGGDKPTEMDITTGRLGFVKERGRVSVRLNGALKSRSYENVSRAGVVIDNSDRDRLEQDYTAQLGYEFSPNYEAYTRYRYVNIDYDKLTNGVVERDSDGHELTAGTDVHISGKVKGEVFAGYMGRDYDSPLEDIDTMKLGGSLVWNVSGLTSIKAEADRNILEIDSATASGYIRSEVSLGVEHALRRNVVWDGMIGYRDDDYQGSGRNDETLFAQTGIEYSPFRGGKLGLAYQYLERDSSIAAANYDNNRVLITAGFTY